MRCIVVYDIPDDRLRTKVADLCLDYGLDRIQYSAFLGERMTRNLMDELMQRIRRVMRGRPGKVLLLPLPANLWRERLEYWVEKEDS